MKKRLIGLVLALTLVASISTPAMAVSDTGSYRLLMGTLESEICTATFIDSGKGGNLLLSLSSIPDASIVIMDKLSFVCEVANNISIGPIDIGSILGCNYVDLGDKFYRHVDTRLVVDVRLFDAGTGDFVWEGPMKDGDIIYLGNDHPSGYIIRCRPHFNSLPFVKLVVLDNNLELS